MILTDQQIAALLTEEKPVVTVPELLRELAAKSEAVGRSRVASRTVLARDGGSFTLRVRQSELDAYDFSIILTYAPARGAEFILRRHNGPSHRHRNPIEDETFEGVCHVHEATERYQLRGSNAEHYAWPTERFHDVATALACMLTDAHFATPAEAPFPDL